METLHPPYGPGSIQPRRLNRWLDVNSQNGPLTRTAKYIVIPQIPPIIHSWAGTSELVGVIYYCAPKNFSLKHIPHHYTDKLNFLLCIAYLVDDGIVNRYVINDVARPGFYLNAPVYKGQLIGKSFRFEIWTTSASSPATIADSPPIYTTVLGDFDYRFADDDALVDYLGGKLEDFTIPFLLSFDVEWPLDSTFGSGVCMRGLPPIIVPPISGGGTRQVYFYTGTTPTSPPDDPTIAAVSYALNGDGPMFTWNTVTYVWE